MKYLSDKLLDQLNEDKEVMMTLVGRKRAQKIIRDYFIRIHNEAVESEVMASNKKNYVKPNFTDGL